MNNRIYSIIKGIVPVFVKKKLKLLYYFLYKKERYKHIKFWCYEHHASFGALNPDKHFFVIRKIPKSTGLLSCYVGALGQLKELVNTDYIPIIDMQSHYYELIHNRCDLGCSINAWEYYFERLSNYSMEEVLQSADVTFSKGIEVESAKCFYNNDIINRDMIRQWIDLNNVFFRLKPELKARYDHTCDKLLTGKRVLGVMFRESYVALAAARDDQPNLYKTHPGIEGHPIQPSVQEYIDAIRHRMSEWDCQYIFLVCETQLILDAINSAFPYKVLFTNRKRRSLDVLTLEKYRSAEKEYYSGYEMVDSNKDYLEEIYVLAHCTSILAGKCSGSIVACLWNNDQYENIQIFQKGVY